MKKKLIIPLFLVIFLITASFVKQASKPKITKDKDGNYVIPEKVLSAEDATALIQMTRFSAAGHEVCSDHIGHDYASRGCYHALSSRATHGLDVKVKNVLSKYL